MRKPWAGNLQPSVERRCSWRVVIIVVLSSVLLLPGQIVPVSAEQFVVGSGEVVLPKGVFLLVRKSGEIGALRFSAIQQGKEVGTGSATYESYLLADGSNSFRSSNIQRRTGNNELKPLKGIGRISFQPGRDRVRIGHWSFRSTSPGTVSMWPYRGSQRDYGYEFAPTSARDVREIDPTDERLRWFRYDRNSRVAMPVANLPK